MLALTPAPDAVDLDTVDVGADERVALLLGAEGPGLTVVAQEAADLRVRIPITPGVDSLNVGHAAAVALHHVAASRRRRPSSCLTWPTAAGARSGLWLTSSVMRDHVSHRGAMGPKYRLTK